MNTNALYLGYARVIKMCQGTNLKNTPWVCTRGKLKDSKNWSYFVWHPDFSALTTDEVDFAVAVVEGKPVFVGDPVFLKIKGYPKVDWDLFQYWSTATDELSEYWTWTQSALKRTFILNGTEMPSPVRYDGDAGVSLSFRGCDENFYFDSEEDAKKVLKGLKFILIKARDS